MHIERLPTLDNSVSRIVSTSRATAQLHAFAENIYDLALALVAPYRTQARSVLRRVFQTIVACHSHWAPKTMVAILALLCDPTRCRLACWRRMRCEPPFFEREEKVKCVRQVLSLPLGASPTMLRMRRT